MALARFQRTVVDGSGNILSGATVTVRDQATNSLVSLFSDRAGEVGITNPFTTGSDGLAVFHAAGGAYKIVATDGTSTVTWEWVGVGTNSEFDFSDLTDYIDTVIADAAISAQDDGTLLANTSGESAPPTAQTLSAFLDSVVSSAQGGLLVRGAAGWEVLAAGDAGQLLTAQGAGATPSYQDAPSLGFTAIIKTADQSRTSSTAFTDDTELQFEMAANTSYFVRCYYVVDMSGGGYKLACNGPAGVSKVDCFAFATLLATAYDTQISQNTGTSTTTNAAGLYIIVRNGATAGTFAMRVAQYQSSASATLFRSGSNLEYAVIA